MLVVCQCMILNFCSNKAYIQGVVGLVWCSHQPVSVSRFRGRVRTIIINYLVGSSLQSEGSRLGPRLPHRHCLFVSVGSSLSVSQGSGHLPVLGQVEGSDLLSLLDLLLIGLDLALELVDQSLHPLVILPVLISLERKFLDSSLRLAEVLGNITIAPGLGIQLRLQLADTSLHLDHGLPSTFQCIHLGLISPLASILALSLQQLLVLLQVHGQILFLT